MRYVTFFALLAAGPVLAAPLEGSHRVFLEANDGTRIEIARIEAEAGAYALTMRQAAFEDHFLSMRPFKCLEGPQKHWCHVPYPYEIRRQVTTEDLVDLEYDFLFVWKGATEYGINMWNGVYYVLEQDGDQLIGRLHEMDMDILSAPPDPGELRPVTIDDLEPGEPESHWLPVLVVQ